MSFDDLHFTNGRTDASTPAESLCVSCLRLFPNSERLCPTCGMRLRRLEGGVSAQQQRQLVTALERLQEQQEYDEEREESSSGGGAAQPANHTRTASAAPGSSAGPAAAAAAASDPMVALSSLLSSLFAGAGAGGGAAAAATAAASGSVGELGAGAAFEGLDAALLASLQGAASGTDDRPAAESAVAALQRIKVSDPTKDFPVQCSVRLHATGRELAAVPGAFSPPVPSHALRSGVEGPAVWCDPADAATELKNAAALKGAVAVVRRGVVSFAVKAHRAQAAGACAVLVVNQAGAAWPYTMTDSKGEAAGLRIPVLMVRTEDGDKLRDTVVSVNAAPTVSECAVCADAFCAGATAVVMPCAHVFHEDCLLPWLKRRATCPLCRAALPEADDADVPGDGAAEGEGGAGAASMMRRLQRDWQRSRQDAEERERMSSTWYS